MNSHSIGRIKERMKAARTVNIISDRFCCFTWGDIEAMYQCVEELEKAKSLCDLSDMHKSTLTREAYLMQRIKLISKAIGD